MKKDGVILIAEDDERHFELIRRNLLRAGIHNEMVHLADGRRTLDYLSRMSVQPESEHRNQECILLLDVCMPEMGGVEVLEKIKQDRQLSKMPVIMLTAVDDAHTIEQCHNLGCNTYIVKPTEDPDFEVVVQELGSFLSVVEIASIR